MADVRLPPIFAIEGPEGSGRGALAREVARRVRGVRLFRSVVVGRGPFATALAMAAERVSALDYLRHAGYRGAIADGWWWRSRAAAFALAPEEAGAAFAINRVVDAEVAAAGDIDVVPVWLCADAATLDARAGRGPTTRETAERSFYAAMSEAGAPGMAVDATRPAEVVANDVVARVKRELARMAGKGRR